MMKITLKKLGLISVATVAIALPVFAQQANPVPGPYQVMVIPVSPRAMTPENMDPRNVFPTYAPALPYWMQAPQLQAVSQQTPAEPKLQPQNQQTNAYAQPNGQPYARQTQVWYLPPQNYGNQQGYGYAPAYGNRPYYGLNYGNNAWGMPSFVPSSPWGNNSGWTNFGPFSN